MKSYFNEALEFEFTQNEMRSAAECASDGSKKYRILYVPYATGAFGMDIDILDIRGVVDFLLQEANAIAANGRKIKPKAEPIGIEINHHLSP